MSRSIASFLFMPLAACALFGSGCAAPLCGTEVAGWKAVRSEHFTVYTDSYGPRQAYYVDRLERIYGMLAPTPFLGKLPDKPIEVVAFDNPTEFMEHFGFNRQSVAMHGVGAGDHTDGLVFMHLDSPEDTMAHGLAHHLARAGGPTIPTWLEEGLASYLETVVLIDGVVRVGVRPQRFSEASFGRFVPLDKLLASTWDDFNGNWRRYYAITAVTTVGILVAGDGVKLRPAWPEFRQALQDGATVQQAFDKAWPGLTLAEIGDAMDQFVRMRKMSPWLPFKPLAGSRDIKGEPDATAAQMQGLCKAASRITDDTRDAWPDFVLSDKPAAAPAPAAAPPSAPASAPAPAAAAPATPPAS